MVFEKFILEGWSAVLNGGFTAIQYYYRELLEVQEDSIMSYLITNFCDKEIFRNKDFDIIEKNYSKNHQFINEDMIVKLKKVCDYEEENNNEDEEEENNNIFSQTQTTMRVGNAIITKENIIPYKGKKKNDNKKPKIKKEEYLENNNVNINELKEIIKEQKDEIDNIKLELENINQLNKDYEIMLQDYKIKKEQKKMQKNNNKKKDAKNKERNKLLKELEMWKKEYCDLFNRTANSSSLISKNIKPKLLSNNLLKKHFYNNINKIDDTNINLYKSMPNNEMRKILNRPQTARVKSTKSTDFDDLCEGIKIMYRRNEFADVLEEKTDDEEEEKNENINEQKVEKEEKHDLDIDNNKDEQNLVVENEPNFDVEEDEKDYDGNDIIPDDDIDELFRKSCADIQKMREEIKFMNESIDKNSNNNIQNNKNNNKPKLNPVIIKKEKNPNFIGGKGLFGINQAKK
jgi:hypothetical protein